MTKPFRSVTPSATSASATPCAGIRRLWRRPNPRSVRHAQDQYRARRPLRRPPSARPRCTPQAQQGTDARAPTRCSDTVDLIAWQSDGRTHHSCRCCRTSSRRRAEEQQWVRARSCPGHKHTRLCALGAAIIRSSTCGSDGAPAFRKKDKLS